MLKYFIVAFTLLFFLSPSPVHAKYETPPYVVTQSWGKVEQRIYKPYIVAEVTVDGPKEQALTNGFKQIASYIFGKNVPNEKISMTAPVTQEPAEKKEKPKGESIPMTAPVTQQGDTANGPWKIQFMMPAEYTLETLPKPENENIKLYQVPERKFMALQFSGFAKPDNFAKRVKQLREFMELRNFRPAGEPVEAYYDPPWQLPFLRRNEVMIEVH
ncbi:MAG: heme-binding protein [Alphaproteobacteria bacterium]|nr:heme-binding protein [Alphaproteobacteria bacterium]